MKVTYTPMKKGWLVTINKLIICFVPNPNNQLVMNYLQRYGYSSPMDYYNINKDRKGYIDD